MTDERIKEYLMNGGNLFMVTLIDSYRMTPTVRLIKTTKDTYYIHEQNNTIQTSLKFSEKNIITNKLFIEYLISRINTYKRSLEKIIEVDIKKSINVLESNLLNTH
jgi:hypothetical protein